MIPKKDNSKHLLVLMMYWYPYEGPIPAIYREIFNALLEKNYKITIVTSLPHFRYGRSDTWEAYRGKLFQRERTAAGIDIVRLRVLAPVFRSPRFRFVFRFLNYISYAAASLAAGLIFSRKTNLVLAPTSPPLFAGVNAWLISAIRRVPFVYNIQDLYPDNFVSLGIFNKKSIPVGFFFRAERFLLKKSSAVTAISGKMRKIIEKKGIPSEKIFFIPNFHNTETIRPLPKENSFSRHYNLKDKFVVSYIGSVSFTHGIEFVLQAARRLQHYTGICFMIIGRGEYMPEINRMAEKERLENVMFIPPQPYDKINEVWAASDVSIVCMRKNVSGYQVPSKTYGIMAAGRPVIAMIDRDSEIENVVSASKAGIWIPPERADLLAEKVVFLYENEDLRKKMGMKGRSFVEKHYSKNSVSEKYDRLFRDLIYGKGT